MKLTGLSPVLASAYVRFTPGSSSSVSAARGADYATTEFLRAFLSQTVEIKEHLVNLKDTLAASLNSSGAPQTNAVAVSVASSQSLGLDLSTTAATLKSTDEINAVPTSLSPFGPAFSGASTSLPTLGGAYDGQGGDDVLTFNVRKFGTVGGPYTGKNGTPAELKLEIQDGSGRIIQDVIFDESVAPDSVFTLVNGLTVSFSAGSLAKNDTFQVAVFASVPSVVDPAKPVDGVRNDNPNFEPGLTVHPGSFTVNGVVIAVNTGDSINTILQRINQSAAGVAATFDADTETIGFTQNTQGSSHPIDLANDTSGFLAATKLTGAVRVAGTNNDLNRPLAEVASLAGIRNGSFMINGVSIAVATQTDSLNDLLAAINQSGAGVTATFVNDQVQLRANNSRASLTLEDGNSGFFTALHLTPQTYRRVVVTSSSASVDTRSLARLVNDEFNALGDQLQKLFNPPADAPLQNLVQAARDQVTRGLLQPLSHHLGLGETQAAIRRTLDTRLGLTFAFAGSVSNFIHPSELGLRAALDHSPAKLAEFLLAESSDASGNGLLPSLIATFENLETEWQTRLGLSQGLRLDQLA